jgi:myo-inositol-1(or 4)-monophosphatase
MMENERDGEFTGERVTKRLLEILKAAGKVSMDLIENSDPVLKSDHSVVTRADKAISLLAKESLQEWIDSGRHLLIDEEDADHARFLDDRELDARTYHWALDPIDGTRPYANRLPYFGISLGVLKNRRPWIGGVLFPMLDELFYCDGDAAYFVRRPFSTEAVSREIKPGEMKVDHHAIFFCTDGFFHSFRWDSPDCHMVVPACAVADLCWPSIGRGCGCLFRANLWDFAGAWPIFQKAGLALRSFAEGKILDRLDLADYQMERRSWKLQEFHILSSEYNFSTLRSRLKSVR